MTWNKGEDVKTSKEDEAEIHLVGVPLDSDFVEIEESEDESEPEDDEDESEEDECDNVSDEDHLRQLRQLELKVGIDIPEHDVDIIEDIDIDPVEESVAKIMAEADADMGGKLHISEFYLGTWEKLDRMIEKRNSVVESRGEQKCIEFFMDYDGVSYEVILDEIAKLGDVMWGIIKSYEVYKHAYKNNYHIHVYLHSPIENSKIIGAIKDVCQCDKNYLDFVEQYGFMIAVNEIYMKVDEAEDLEEG